jgi:hypothetical protein
MRKVFFILLLIPFGLHLSAQNDNETFIVYDVLIADTNKHLPKAVWEYAYKNKYINNIPYEQRQLLFADLYQSIIDKKYFQYWYDFTEVSGSYEFPVISVDTIQIQYPFPPYETRDTVCIQRMENEQVLSIRFYETWVVNDGVLTKDILAFSFILLRYDFHTKKLRLDEPTYEPLLFIKNKSMVPYLKKKLNR